MPSELNTLYKDREKIITDKWIETKGISVKIKPVLIEDNGVIVRHDLDPFAVDVNSLGYEEGSITQYGLEYTTKAVFVNENFQFTAISHDIMIEDLKNQSESSNFNEVYCFVQGGIVPKYSILTFLEHINIQMKIEEISKKRPLSDIHKYRLVRC